MSDDHSDPALDPDDLDISRSEYVRELGDDRYVVSAGAGPPRAPPDPEDDAPDADAEARSPESAGDVAPDDSKAPSVSDIAARDLGGGAEASADAADVPTGSDALDGLPGDDGTATSTQPAAEPSGGASRQQDESPGSPASHSRRGAPSQNRGSSAAAGDVDAATVGQWLAESLSESEFEYGFDATLSFGDETTRHRMASDDVVEAFETLATWFAASAAGDDATAARALGILLVEMDSSVEVPAAAVTRSLADLGLSRSDSIDDLLAAMEESGGLTLE
ncbi:DUF7500 family protein [Halobaculum sp. D14]|uniref:DUF7500 family protein n=1 Tax=Halobaculum sp. D14 TaxID=3421642 RepID=UPI003EB7BF6A